MVPQALPFYDGDVPTAFKTVEPRITAGPERVIWGDIFANAERAASDGAFFPGLDRWITIQVAGSSDVVLIHNWPEWLRRWAGGEGVRAGERAG